MIPGSWGLQACGYGDNGAMRIIAHLCPAAVDGLQPEARPCLFPSLQPAPSHPSVPPPPTLRNVLATVPGPEAERENNCSRGTGLCACMHDG